MTTIEEHKSIIKELLEDINEKIRADLVERRQKIIAFAASEASVNVFAVFLHKNDYVSPGFNINHRFFSSSKRANEVFDFDFPKKEEIIEFLVKQESHRDKLCYGKSKDKAIADAAIQNLNALKTLIEMLIGESL